MVEKGGVFMLLESMLIGGMGGLLGFSIREMYKRMG